MSVPADASNASEVRRARRAALADHPTQIGIDFVAVDLDRRLLTVLFIAAAPGVAKATPLAAIGRSNIRITGGQDTRPANVRVLRVEARQESNSLSVAYEHDAEAFRGSDFPSYVLEIVDVPQVDPFFARAEFSLRPEEPAAFDPAPTPLAPPSVPADIEIDYLARDYASFRRLMLDRLSLRMPRWSERNPADIGVAVVEVLAYAADHLSYYQDAVATEAYLGTARRRTSVRRHATLLDYAMHEGCNARVWVQVTIDSDGVDLPRGTALLTRNGPQARLATDASAPAVMVASGARWFETLHGTVLHAALHELRIHTWGAPNYVLPAGAVTATLRDGWLDAAEPAKGRKLDHLHAGQVLILEEIKGVGSGEPADADIGHRHALRLTRVTRGFDPLGEPSGSDAAETTKSVALGVPVVQIEWPAADALPFAATVAAVQGEQAMTDICVFRGNVVLADYGRTIDRETLPEVSFEGIYRPELRRRPITCVVPYDDAQAASQPAASTLRQDPRAAVPQLTLTERTPASVGPAATWFAVPRLLQSDRFAREFVLEAEADGRAALRFGDGIRGRRPSAGISFKARYRIGNGVDGNVGADSIAHIVSDDPRLIGVRNPLPACGGSEPEALEQVRLQAPSAFQTQERCVTAEDYRVMAERHPAVREAAVDLRWTGGWHTAFVAVVRRGGAPIDAAFRLSVATFLSPFQLAGVDLDIRAPRYVSLDIRLIVQAAPDHFRSKVRQMLCEAFSNADLSAGRQGFFHPDRFGFGQPLYLSPIVATAMAISGVTQVDVDRFQRWGRPARGELDAGRIDIGPLEIARVDSDPNAPENGLIAFLLQGGQ